MPNLHLNKRKFTPKRVDLLVDLIRKGHLMSDACALAQITPACFILWMNKGRDGIPGYDDFYTRIIRAEAIAVDRAVTVINTSIKNGSVDTAKWYLGHRRHLTYGEKLKIDTGLQKIAEEMTSSERQHILELAGYKKLTSEQPELLEAEYEDIVDKVSATDAALSNPVDVVSNGDEEVSEQVDVMSPIDSSPDLSVEDMDAILDELATPEPIKKKEKPLPTMYADQHRHTEKVKALVEASAAIDVDAILKTLLPKEP